MAKFSSQKEIYYTQLSTSDFVCCFVLYQLRRDEALDDENDDNDDEVSQSSSVAPSSQQIQCRQ